MEKYCHGLSFPLVTANGIKQERIKADKFVSLAVVFTRVTLLLSAIGTIVIIGPV